MHTHAQGLGLRFPAVWQTQCNARERAFRFLDSPQATVWVMNSLDEGDVKDDDKRDVRSTDDQEDYGYEY